VSTEPAAIELLRALVPALARFGGRWYLFGAQAVLVWGRPRLTGDVDVTIFLDPDDPHAFVTAMQEAGFDLRVRNIEDFVARTRVFPFTHVPSGLALDAVLGGPGFEEEFVRTARPVDIGGLVVPVIAPEELVVTKILAGRSKDLDDVQGILRSQGDALDLTRVRDLLTQLQVAINQSDLLPALEAQLRVVYPR
jgi:Nucleotidyl transferase AbiEii toxin, Type IV TA system